MADATTQTSPPATEPTNASGQVITPEMVAKEFQNIAKAMGILKDAYDSVNMPFKTLATDIALDSLPKPHDEDARIRHQAAIDALKDNAADFDNQLQAAMDHFAARARQTHANGDDNHSQLQSAINADTALLDIFNNMGKDDKGNYTFSDQTMASISKDFIHDPVMRAGMEEIDPKFSASLMARYALGKVDEDGKHRTPEERRKAALAMVADLFKGDDAAILSAAGNDITALTPPPARPRPLMGRFPH